jgi:hypothetical protein
MGHFLRAHDPRSAAPLDREFKASASPPPELNSTLTFVYGPFRIESEIDIPELRNLTGPGERLVRLYAGGVPAQIAAPDHTSTPLQLSASEYLLSIPDIARYYVAHGNEIRVEPAPGAPVANVSTYLLGSCFGALCHQNGLLPLHASAVASGDSVTAFLGDSGAGKSTLAACLHRRGYVIVSDDICLLDPSDPANPRVIPVAGWLKLWNQTLEHLGHTPEEEHRVFSTDDKYRVFLPDSEGATRRLTRVVFLSRCETPEAPSSLARLSVPEAVAALMDMTYAVYIPVLTGQQPRLFRECAGVFRHAQAYRLTRPWSLERTDEVLDLVERELLDSAPQAT